MSGKVAIQKSTLEAIGEAVRGKEGTTDLIPVNTLADRIAALPSGINKLPQIIEGTVTEITAEDLEECTNIRNYAFDECTALTKVTIGDNIKSIGEAAFRLCSNLTNVTIGSGVTHIKTLTFIACSNLTEITLGSAVKSIGDRAFEDCKKLTNIYYNGDIVSWCAVTYGNVSASPFQYAKKLYVKNSFGEYEIIAELVIPSEVTKISAHLFAYYTGLTSVTIPNSVTHIGGYTFYNCTNLKSVTIGNGIISISVSTFRGCSNLIDFTITSPISNNIGFSNSTKLTIDSLKNIINALVDYSGTENEGKNTLTLNSTCNATLEAEGATAPDGLTWKEYVWAKGWNLA